MKPHFTEILKLIETELESEFFNRDFVCMLVSAIVSHLQYETSSLINKSMATKIIDLMTHDDLTNTEKFNIGMLIWNLHTFSPKLVDSAVMQYQFLPNFTYVPHCSYCDTQMYITCMTAPQNYAFVMQHALFLTRHLFQVRGMKNVNGMQCVNFGVLLMKIKQQYGNEFAKMLQEVPLGFQKFRYYTTTTPFFNFVKPNKKFVDTLAICEK